MHKNPNIEKSVSSVVKQRKKFQKFIQSFGDCEFIQLIMYVFN